MATCALITTNHDFYVDFFIEYTCNHIGHWIISAIIIMD
jgi:hypothetical protein